ncbi:hypothetical protein ACP43V_05965, partial [Vibrio genomosp. F10 str. 9ZC157]|uniref:hypothetical protein n=1 Tax=Vibrio genomosp. F10 TaxID=723171 RepID=UPI001A7E07FE
PLFRSNKHALHISYYEPQSLLVVSIFIQTREIFFFFLPCCNNNETLISKIRLSHPSLGEGMNASHVFAF